MIRQNLHTHTYFDDGSASPMAMARAAAEAGLESLGFSGHAPLPYADTWDIKANRFGDYLAEVAAAKAAFADRLAVYSGLEYDIVCDLPDVPFDYLIGSVHHIKKDGAYLSVDYNPDCTRDILQNHFGGDRDAMAAAYFAQYGAVAKDPRLDIVGHFDLLTKFDEKHGFFDPAAPGFRDPAMAALETLVKADKIFEVNTGAMSRGWRTSPYPGDFFLRELLARKGRITVTSDSHHPETVAHAFPAVEEQLLAMGWKEIWELTDRGFEPRPL